MVLRVWLEDSGKDSGTRPPKVYYALAHWIIELGRICKRREDMVEAGHVRVNRYVFLASLEAIQRTLQFQEVDPGSDETVRQAPRCLVSLLCGYHLEYAGYRPQECAEYAQQEMLPTNFCRDQPPKIAVAADEH